METGSDSVDSITHYHVTQTFHIQPGYLNKMLPTY